MVDSGNKGETKLTDDIKELASLVKDWAEVGLERSKVEIEYRINQMLLQFIAVVIGIFVLFFVLITVALGLGLWLDNPFWGFLIVSVVLVVSVVILRWMRPTFWSFSGSSQKARNMSVPVVSKKDSVNESSPAQKPDRDGSHD